MTKSKKLQINKNSSGKGLLAGLDGVEAGRTLPPMHLWNPPYCGEIDIKITRDGTWFHEGSPIRREGLVRLFASILKYEDGAYYLVSPVEKVKITVEDSPFVVVDMDVKGEGRAQNLCFTTNTLAHSIAGPDNPLRIEIDPVTQEPTPYVHIRAGLEARIDRKTFYRMIELGCHDKTIDGTWFGLYSGGVFFPILATEDLTESGDK